MREFLTIDELSEYLGIKKSSLYAKVERGDIPYYKIDRLIRFKKSDIDLWMEGLKRQPVSIEKKARDIIRNLDKQGKTNIDTIIKKAIDGVTGNRYNLSKGKPGQRQGLRKED